MHQIRTIKGLFALSYLAIYYIVESLLIVRWTIPMFLQASVLNISILLGLYAFRAFDNTTLKSLNSSLVSYLSGSLFGSAFSLIIIAFFQYKLPKEVFFLNLFISIFIFSTLSVFIFRRIIKALPPKRFLVIGREDDIGDILNEVQEKSMGKLQIIGYINPSPATLTTAIETEKLFDGILIGDPSLAKEVETTIDKARTKGIEIQFLPNIVEDQLKRIPLEMIDKFKEYYEVVFSEMRPSQRKKVLDVLLTTFFLIISSPLFLIFSILLPIQQGFPILFKQKRIGQGLEPFTFIKFRSLMDIEKEKLKNHKNPNETIEKRVTKAGRFLRKTRLDELPQFFNVLNGSMSLIGPRPEMINYHEQGIKNIPYYSFRYKTKPGITGWAQIKYQHTSTLEDYKKKTEYDLYYIKNQCLTLDLQIILQTIETMLGMRGSK
ncbi:MAG: exopolysaccharide biosynthesis polyprenyl glycosylphosphotransferase [Kosmotoga sp.]|nr:MAG: exopolysaccharide biosynthesis polyprenyl glycosylphosphotransferase [Kosmotoga sp.]